MDQLFDIAAHFEVLAATIAALKVAYGDDPAVIASLDAAEERIDRAAMLLKTQIIESEAYDAFPASADNDNEASIARFRAKRTDTNGPERGTTGPFGGDPTVSE
jgi:uncharacterized ferritin-like protein (DUF455 family)